MTPPLPVQWHPSGAVTYQDRRDQIQPGDTMIILVSEWHALNAAFNRLAHEVDDLHIVLARQTNALADDLRALRGSEP